MIRLRVEVLLAASIVAMLVATPFSATTTGYLFFVVCFFALLLFDASPWQKKQRLTLFLFLAAAAVVSSVSVGCSLGGFNAATWLYLQNYIYPLALFLVLANARLKHLNDRNIAFALIAGIVTGVCAAAPVAVYVSRTTFHPLYFPGIPAVNHSAAYICFAMAALFVTASSLRRRPVPLLAYTLSALFILLGFLTRSRSFVLGAASVTGAYFLLLRRSNAVLREILLVGAGLAVALAVAALAFSDAVSRMLRNLAGDFFHGRLEIWSDSLSLFSRYPGCGIGLGKFRDIAFNPIYAERRAGEFYMHGHNIVLNALAEGGILLFVAVAAVVAVAVAATISALRTRAQSPLVWLLLLTWATFCLFGILDDTIVSMLTYVPALCFGFLFALQDPDRRRC